MLRSLLALSAILLATAPAAAQSSSGDSLLVLVVDPGPTRVNQTALRRAIGGATERTVIRMTDERAQQARARLTIGFSRPDRWVLRYEARGQVAWVSDRIRPGALQSRLAELSRDVIGRVDGSPRMRRREAWNNDDLILALQNEIVDPFADDPPRRHRDPVTVLWSEVVDPFVDQPPRADAGEVWSEVLDPWSQRVDRSRR